MPKYTEQQIADLYMEKYGLDPDAARKAAADYKAAKTAKTASPPPAAKPPAKPTNAAQKGDNATPPKGGPKGTVTQKAPVVAREPVVTLNKPSDFMGEGPMLGPERPPRQPAAQLPPATGSHAADPFPARPRDPTIPERIRASTEADVQRRRAEARATAAGNRDVVNTYVREPVKRAINYASDPIRSEFASDLGRGSLMDFIEQPSRAPTAARQPVTSSSRPSFQPSPAQLRALEHDQERLAAIDIPNAYSLSAERVAELMASPAVQKALAE